MIHPRTMPIIMIACSLLAAIVYGCQGDYRRATYWTAGAILNISVTF